MFRLRSAATSFVLGKETSSEMKAQSWVKAIIRAIMCLSGIVGNNWLAFSSMPNSLAQLRTNDMLFINLAISNLITNYLVDIPDTLDFVMFFPEGWTYCGTFTFCSELSETSSIFTTMFITVYWHQKLVGSLRRGGAPVQMDNVRLVAALVAGSWIFAVVFSVPHYYFISPEINRNVSTGECYEMFPTHESKQSYELLYLILANAVPIIGIATACIQITVTLLQNERRIRANTKAKKPKEKIRNAQHSAETAVKSNAVAPKSQAKSGSSSGSLVRAAKSVVAVATIFIICWVTHLIVSIISTVVESTVVMEIASYIGAIYTCVIPYIYLFGVKKLNCSSTCLC